MSTTCINHMVHQKRRQLQEITAVELEPLESQFTEQWPEVWREIARSCYITLLAIPETKSFDRATLARRIAEGVVADLGGTQPYIPVGVVMQRHARVLELRAQGEDYQSIARECGLTERRVRNIERDQRSSRTSSPLAKRIAFQQTKDQQ